MFKGVYFGPGGAKDSVLGSGTLRPVPLQEEGERAEGRGGVGVMSQAVLPWGRTQLLRWPRVQHCVKTYSPPVLPTWRTGSKGAPRCTLRVSLPLLEEGKEKTEIPDMKTRHRGHRALDHAEAPFPGARGCHCNTSGTVSTGKEWTRCRRNTSSNRNGTPPQFTRSHSDITSCLKPMVSLGT